MQEPDMTYFLTKTLISAVLIVAIAEIARRSSMMGAILASVPLVSVLAMLWLYHDTHDAAKVASLATGIFWLVIPSLALFISLPLLIKNGVEFYLSMGISIVITIVCYFVMLGVLSYYGIKI